MAEKLRIALRQVHWSLALRAAVFAASWLILPFWAFCLIAAYLYFIPFFQPWKLAAPFLVIFFFAAIETPTLWMALFLGVAWFLMLGIKDLVFIDRKSEYELLVLVLIFLIAVRFFFYFDSWKGQSPIFYVLAMGFAIFFLCDGYLGYGDSPASPLHAKRSKISAGLAAIVLSELSLPFLVLPLHFLYQSSLFFVAAVIILELLFEHANGTLTRRALLVRFSIFFVFLVIILGSAQWTL